MKTPLLICSFILIFTLIQAQETESISDSLRKDALNVYMDASDHIKKEITFINYVRDIKDAHLYIISTSQRTGSGGWENTYFFVGQKEFAGMKDTLRFVSSPDETQDGIRKKSVNTLKMGLMRYVAKTPLSNHIDIVFNTPLSETIESDKWNSWVFRSSISGFLQGEKSYNSSMLFGRFSANRITEKSKLEMSMNYHRGEDNFNIEDDIISSINKSSNLSILNVYSINNHWSAGGSASVGSSTYNNYQLRTTVLPGIEYNIYPYSESTRRQLRILYRVGIEYNNYLDTTIYNKTEELLYMHSLSAALEVIQKWGSVNFNCHYRNYLHDFSKRNLSINGYMNLRLFKGFSVNMGGGAALVHDQLALVKGGATAEEILLRRKELASQYWYFASFGISYTFGSIYNNVVNPRFGSGSGGGMSISF
jgi:hypothetical protein